MAKKKNNKQVVYPVVFMVVLSIVFGGALEGINTLTKDIIAQQEALRLKENVLYVLGFIPSQADAKKEDKALLPSEIEALYAVGVVEKPVGDTTVYVGSKDGTLVGYAFEVSGPGLWGSMIGYAAISADQKSLLGMSVVSHSETPGLGGRIDETWFKEQFRNVPIAAAQPEFVIFKPKAGGNIDAIAGATLTSESVRVMINQDVAAFIANYGGDL